VAVEKCGTPSLAAVAAALAGANLPDSLEEQPRWLNYYGPFGTIPSVSYSDVQRQTNGFFQGKVVFVGSHRKSPYAFEEAEEFRTPHNRFGVELCPGVILTVTEFLNLTSGKTLTRLTASNEVLTLLFAGVLLGGGLCRVRPWVGGIIGLTGGMGLAIAAYGFFLQKNVWFAWAITSFLQVPFAMGWSVLSHGWTTRREKEWLEKELSEASERADGRFFQSLSTIIGQACDPDIEFRYQTAGELLQDLVKLQTEAES